MAADCCAVPCTAAAQFGVVLGALPSNDLKASSKQREPAQPLLDDVELAVVSRRSVAPVTLFVGLLTNLKRNSICEQRNGVIDPTESNPANLTQTFKPVTNPLRSGKARTPPLVTIGAEELFFWLFLFSSVYGAYNSVLSL